MMWEALLHEDAFDNCNMKPGETGCLQVLRWEAWLHEDAFENCKMKPGEPGGLQLLSCKRALVYTHTFTCIQTPHSHKHDCDTQPAACRGHCTL